MQNHWNLKTYICFFFSLNSRGLLLQLGAGSDVSPLYYAHTLIKSFWHSRTYIRDTLQIFKIETECLASFMAKGRGILLDQVCSRQREQLKQRWQPQALLRLNGSQPRTSNKQKLSSGLKN